MKSYQAEGLTDFFEVHGWPIRYLNATSVVKDNYTMSNPNMKDGDADGIPNQREVAYGTDPFLRDSDGDGIIDSMERYWHVDSDQDNRVNAVGANRHAGRPDQRGRRRRVRNGALHG